MKNFIGIVLAASLLSACGNNKQINGVTYGRYGVLNEKDMKNDKIRYEMVWGNIVWSVFLSETVVAPIYFIGFDLYQPMGTLSGNEVKGAVN